MPCKEFDNTTEDQDERFIVKIDQRKATEIKVNLRSYNWL